MKICQCFTMAHSSYIGGVSTLINNYLDNMEIFEKNGCEISLFDYQNSHIDKSKSKINKFFRYAIKQRKALIDFIKKNKIDLVHIHTSCRSLFLKDVFLAKYIKRKTGKKICLTIHVGDASTVFAKIPHLIKPYLIQILNKSVCKVFFLSNQIYTQFLQLGLKPSVGEVLYNFHNMDVNLGLEKGNNETINLLFVGMINKDKGIIEFLNAIARMPESKIHLDICGEITDNSIKEKFEELTRNNSRVTLHGYVKGNAKSKIFEKADVLVLPSYHEGLPLVILEALASKCAIISTPVGAIPEILNEENYIKINPRSIEDIVIAISTFEKDRQNLRDMQRANGTLSNIYCAESHINKLCSYYVGI